MISCQNIDVKELTSII